MSDLATDDLMDVDPSEVSPGDIDIGLLRAGLRAEKNLVRTRAAQISAAYAAEDADVAAEVAPTLADTLDDERAIVLKEVLAALGLIADERPDELGGHTGALVALLDDDLPLIQAFAARTLRPVAAARPEWFADHVDALLGVLDRGVVDPTEGLEPRSTGAVSTAGEHDAIGEEERTRQLAVQGFVADVVVAVAETDSDALVSHVPALIDLLDGSEALVRAASADAIATVAEDHPDAANAAVDPLCECLGARDETVVARAVTALGFIGDERAVEPLRDLADDEDEGEDVRALADETAGWLAANAG